MFASFISLDLSLHIEKVGDEEEEDMWWLSEEEEYVEEEEEGAFELEPEERSKLAAEKGQQFWVFDLGGLKLCVSGSAAGVIVCNGVLFDRH
jgi:hypothetical protein